ncbi:TIGR01244 family sulfur transferase [Sphingomonas sp. LaA6.9]|uniref:TIGR01244 family sulfur transferase n=1 Tax=Sphingomonas sp. LaA6.9 TaxID=2919914 RepID=UPI001F501A19|nr:TIGR01244 family sulfur transferase [Sphingomonas sp. LaA6.9]MCJ8156287.1 TIGR01244 family sulfur transferase [Sphingomonas sp. LaA6.9]
MFRRIDDSFSVAPQITPDQVAAAKADGVTMIINNRPDDEEAGQTNGAEIAAAAEAAGIGYRAIPVTHAGFSANQLDEMNAALDAAGGQVLAYCRSGTRSTYLWALARAQRGDAPDMLAEKAAAAGYDLLSIRPMLDALSGGR